MQVQGQSNQAWWSVPACYGADLCALSMKCAPRCAITASRAEHKLSTIMLISEIVTCGFSLVAAFRYFKETEFQPVQ